MVFLRLLALALVLVPPLALAEPVDTAQFGNVKIGMREAEIMDRLGQPDAIQEQGRSFVPVRTSTGREIIEIRRYTWTYAGNAQVMHTVITFENGVVAGKAKVPASSVRR